ncbi:DUF1275 family protein [Micromonospora okii]|uniref:DUF1275 family protein n=1 Tax=Micromonospora okii TaxID=1182970 RepID=UPI001E2CDD05|nr:DUF1275 family protein [Micromonospora okii]
MALALTTGVAGGLDAFAFLHYGAFVANQSGNAVFLGMGPAGAHPAWPASAASLIAFAAGTGTVTWLRGAARRRTPAVVKLAAAEVALALWAVLNVLLAYGRHDPASRAALAAAGALAMGALTTLITHTAGIATNIAYQSGTVAKTGEHAAGWLTGRDAGRARLGTLLGLLTLASYALGGAVGTLARHQPRWVPVVGALALAAVFPLVRHGGAGGPAARGRDLPRR